MNDETPSAATPSQPPPPAPPAPPPVGTLPPPGSPEVPQRDEDALRGAGAWGPGRTFAGLGILIGVVLAEVLVVSAFDRDLDSLAARLVVQTLLAATMIAVAFVAAQPGAGVFAPSSALGFRRPRPGFVWATVGAYLVYVGCALVIAVLLEPEQEDVARELGADEGALGTIAAGVLIVVGASVSEELFFRGFMFAGLRRAMPFAVAALISAAIWGLFHFTGADSWGVVLQLTVFGVVLCWLYQRTGSIWPPIAVHAFNNALAFSLLVGG